MTKPFGIFGPASPEKEARAEAEADVAAGRVVPHEDVRKWLLSWGQPDELPPPTCR